MSYTEVAEALDIPIGTVGSRRAAAIDKLEVELAHFREATS
jgi:DNA-directed RNA polymerase specialized sigma24 family protein